jgi:N4-gp56 family major capsid protein
MAIQKYSTQAGRINEIKGEMLAHAEPFEVLALGASMKKMPKKSGDNISYRRVIPTGGATTNANTINRWSVTAAAHVVAEGVTPAAESLTYQDVNVVIQQYAVLYSYTDKAAELYEDDIPGDQKIQTAERMGLVREMIRYGSMKAATNVLYSGGTTRLTVDEAISLRNLRNMARTLLANHGKMKNKILAAGPAYDTSAIEAGFIVFCHTDCEADIRDLPGFVPVAKYANRSVLNENEIGSVERFRFIVSPELAPYLAGGAAIGASGLLAADNTTIDVYPHIVVCEDAVFDVALKGDNPFELTHIPHTQKTKDDPFGQRGYVGASFWSAVLVANNGWMGVIEAGVTNLA